MGKILKGDEFKKRMNLKDRLDADLPMSGAALDLGRIVDREMLDASSKSKGILEEAREEALRTRAEAKELLSQVSVELEKARQQGQEQGYQEGLEQGLELLHKVKELRQKLFDDNEREMVRLVFAIAEKIIGREFSENDKAIMNVIRLAVSDAVGEKIFVKLNPQDYVNIKKNEAELLLKIEGGKTLVFKEDEGVKLGGCLVETEIGTIDAQLETQINAIKKALGL
jgi:Flagellar biosynthesis/type III secretory pathway protein